MKVLYNLNLIFFLIKAKDKYYIGDIICYNTNQLKLIINRKLTSSRTFEPEKMLYVQGVSKLWVR